MFVGRGAGKEMTKSVTQIFNSLKTEALNQDFFLLRDCSSIAEGIWWGRMYTEG